MVRFIIICIFIVLFSPIAVSGWSLFNNINQTQNEQKAQAYSNEKQQFYAELAKLGKDQASSVAAIEPAAGKDNDEAISPSFSHISATGFEDYN